MQDMQFIAKIADVIRSKIIGRYGTTAGKCIEASDAITDKINEVTNEVQDITARMKELLTVEEN